MSAEPILDFTFTEHARAAPARMLVFAKASGA